MTRDKSIAEVVTFEEKPNEHKNNHNAESANDLRPSCVSKDELSPRLVFSINLHLISTLHNISYDRSKLNLWEQIAAWTASGN